jgi:hypothetical protein
VHLRTIVLHGWATAIDVPHSNSVGLAPASSWKIEGISPR